MKPGPVVVGMSGGVDSSVSALLLKQQGYAVRGLFMKNWEQEDPAEPCTAAVDAKDALDVCERLGIELEAVNFSREYMDRVFRYFLEEYRRGRTPNPDILCNKEIKFKAFLDHALALGAEGIATGHYARVDERDGRFRLLCGRDAGKDQSYFLYTLTQAQLGRTRFPVGELHKTEVRRLAADAGLANANKKDSTGICFIGERDFQRFLSRYLPTEEGDIRTPAGEVLGRHRGLMYYTLGQRRGLGIGGRRNAGDQPWYVVDKCLRENVLVVAQGHHHAALLSSALHTSTPHWIAGQPPCFPLRCKAKTRYRQTARACTVRPEGEILKVVFDEPQWAITPGQSVVFYQGEECLGGAVIDSYERHASLAGG
ncbi:MAG TPA: tRNA 2-thiouridine(34) synthase MnmA [Gammaproteobacteria bacterium]|nr:tRNA 2-thiouridine(34) synthase MnmA [Gammaproteobacteria bacterium]